MGQEKDMALEKIAWHWKKRAWRWEKGAWRGATLIGAGGNTNIVLRTTYLCFSADL